MKQVELVIEAGRGGQGRKANSCARNVSKVTLMMTM
jgi:hypothetical protein